MNPNDILLVTTPNVEGYKIKNYLGLIDSNQVAGTGFFTDLTASFSDLFGGNSGAYRNSMNELFDDVTTRIKNKATKLGANAVIGVKVDYDSISAKSMSMFMVSIQGTAVYIENPDNNDNKIEIDNTISYEVLYQNFLKNKILKKIANNIQITDDEWNYILYHKIPELTLPLFEYYKNCWAASPVSASSANDSMYNTYYPEWTKSGIKNFESYIDTLDYEEAINIVYEDIKHLKEKITKCRLFNAHKIQELAEQGKINTAVSLLTTEKDFYDSSDLAEMQSLAKYMRNLPDIGKIEDVKGGIFSSGGSKFVCMCGTKNDPNTEYCTECGKNIKGLKKEDVLKINDFCDFVESLESLLGK